MAFTDNIKEITPAITQLKSNTPAIMVDGKVLVNGIGGNYIPAGQGGGSATSMDFYKCSAVYSDSTWSGYKLLQNTDNGYTLQSQSTLVGVYYIRPTIDKIYDSTGKLELKTYYGGDTHDPYGNGLLYSIFINGGTGISAPSEGIVTTDNYTSDVETVNGITARKFTGSQKVTTTAGNTRSTWSYSVWIKGEDYTAISCMTAGIVGVSPRAWASELWFMYKSGNNDYSFCKPQTSNNWNHCVVTYANNTLAVYVDEVAQTFNQPSGDFSAFPSSSGFVFGSLTSAGEAFYKGYIANFRFYDHVLSQAEIAALHAELTPTNS